MIALALAAILGAPRVSTLAGTGRSGTADGAARRASFMGPQGIAYDARGDLFVADTPAQRIREVTAHGVVRTVAGVGAPVLFGAAVAGGYRDGPVAVARFDDPAAVAIGAGGTIYVADERNRAIRVIRAGLVRTLCGGPRRRGHADGSAERAGFRDPRSLAYDPRGGLLYVADVGVGVRRVDARGTVTTLPVAQFSDAIAVALDARGGADELLVGTPRAIYGYDLHRRAIAWSIGTELRRTAQAASLPAGGAILGPPSALAALGPRSFVYTDDLFSTVRVVRGTTVERIGAPPLLNASPVGGGFRDGSDAVARFAQPMGVAVAPDGAIAIADTANKRIRIVPPFDMRTATARAAQATPVRVALIGDRLERWRGSYARSVAGRLQSALCVTAARCPVGVDAYAWGAHPSGYTAIVAIVDGVRDGPAIASLARAYGTRFAVALVPDAAQLPDAALAWKLAIGTHARPAQTAAAYRAARRLLRAQHIRTFDWWRAAAQAARGRALYGASVPQLTPYGCAWLAARLAAALRSARMLLP